MFNQTEFDWKTLSKMTSSLTRRVKAFSLVRRTTWQLLHELCNSTSQGRGLKSPGCHGVLLGISSCPRGGRGSQQTHGEATSLPSSSLPVAERAAAISADERPLRIVPRSSNKSAEHLNSRLSGQINQSGSVTSFKNKPNNNKSKPATW